MALDYFYNVLKKDITMVKGDTMAFGFQIQGLEGSIPSSIAFSCKEDPEDETAIFSINLLNGGIWLDSQDAEHDILTYGVRVPPSITESMDVGRYFYDLEVTINGGLINEDVFTFMKGRLQLEYDVTR